MSSPVDLPSLRGGADRDAALGTLENQLLCPICLEIFTKPVVILPCQHNLCRKCANELYQPSLFQARTHMLVNSGRFRCPSCRQEVVLDRHGVYGLQRNLLVENIIDIYKQEVSNNNATSSSPPPPPPKPLGQVTCSDHEEEKVNIYCLSCRVPTCSLCKVFGAHRACQVAPLTDIYQQQKDELSEEVGSLVAVNDKVQAFINELEETCRTIEENCETQKQSLCEKFDRMLSILEERRKVMTQQISSEQEEKTGHAQSMVRCYGDNAEANAKLLEMAERSLEEPDMAAFVQNSRELITKVISATSSCPVETLKPGYENMSHYRFSFNRQEKALHGIDFKKVEEETPEEPEAEPEPEEPEPEPEDLQEPTVQYMEPEDLQEPTVQYMEPEHLQEPTVQYTEPEHLQEPTVQYMEPEHLQEPTVQNLVPILETALEPIREPIPATTSPPVPVQTALPVAAPVSSVSAVVVDSVDPRGAVLNDQGAGVVNEEKEEKEEVEVEETRGEEEECAASDPVKEGSLCENQDGMSTQQCEEREAERGVGDWMTQRETEEDTEREEGRLAQEDGAANEEEEDAKLYPSWYKPSAWQRVSPGPAAPTEVLPAVAAQIKAQAAAEATSKPRIQPQPHPQVQDSPLQPPQLTPAKSETQAPTKSHLLPPLSSSESHPQPQNMSYPNQQPCGPPLFTHLQLEEPPLSPQLQTQPYLPLLLHPQPQTQLPPQLGNHTQSPPFFHEPLPQSMPVGPGSAVNPVPPQGRAREVAGESASVDEEIHGWVCLSGDVDNGFSLEEGSFDLGEDGSESSEDDTLSTLSIPPEESGSGLENSSSGLREDCLGVGEAWSELGEGRSGVGEGREGILGLKGTSEPEESALVLGESDLGAGKMSEGLEEGSKEPGEDSSGSEEDALVLREDCLGAGEAWSEHGDGSSGIGEGREELGEGILCLKGTSELEESASVLREGNLGAGKVNEGLEEGSKELREDALVLREDSAKLTDDGLDLGGHADHSGENTSTQQQRALVRAEIDPKLEVRSSGLGENKVEAEESSLQPEDFHPKTEGRDAEKGAETTSVRLQAVTLFFYLLAFLVILQRVWAYIGCFICT